MHETDKPSFVHADHFNRWLITSFFLVFSVMLFAFLPVIGVHRAGVAIGEELSSRDEPVKKAIESPKPAPIRRQAEGIPVAYRPSRNGP